MTERVQRYSPNEQEISGLEWDQFKGYDILSTWEETSFTSFTTLIWLIDWFYTYSNPCQAKRKRESHTHSLTVQSKFWVIFFNLNSATQISESEITF